MPGTTLTVGAELLELVTDEPLADPDPDVARLFELSLLHAAASSTSPAITTIGTGTRRTDDGLMIDRRG
jgi:hypothetical protein